MFQHSDTYQLIETAQQLSEFYEENKAISWMCFDTEFIGEKRFTTLLCLVQVATENGVYLLDPLRLDDLGAFLQMIESPSITKVTHAGENDYRLLYKLYGTVPKNVFDTQIAAGFIGYKYPVSFRKLVETELDIHLKKGYAVTDWEARPFSPKMVKYALNDVIYLPQLWTNIKERLTEWKRSSWVQDECHLLEAEAYYKTEPHREALNSNIIKNLKQKEQLFLVRLYDWRQKEAQRLDYSRDMVLSSKLISMIIRSTGAGKDALLQNRRLPKRIVEKYGDLFVKLYQQAATPEELKVLENISDDNVESPELDIITEMLHLVVRHQCLEEQMAPTLVMPRRIVKKMKSDRHYFDPLFENTWRKDFLGSDMIEWLKNRAQLGMSIQDGTFVMRLDKKNSKPT